MGVEFQFYKMKKSEDLLNNNLNIPNTTELYTFKWLKKLFGRRRGWDVSREQHRNMYIT